MSNPGGTAIGKFLNYGYPGTRSRGQSDVVENRPVQDTDSNAISFGSPVVLNSNNTYSLFGASGTMANFAGVAVREVKQATTYLNSPTGTSQYNPGDPCDVLQQGSVIVTCTEGTPTAGGKVYVVTVAGTGAVSAVNDFVATATPAGTGSAAVQITNAQWKTGLIDANNSCELTLLARNMA